MGPKGGKGLCCTITMCILGIIILALSLVLLIAFPISLYPSLIKSQIPLSYNKASGMYSPLTSFWQNLPQVARYDFYFFNITNMDEIVYEGAIPRLVEVGPYSYLETEFKEGIEWMEDDTKVHYRSNKTWIYNLDTSCEGCFTDDAVTLPNAAYATSLGIKAQNDLDSTSIFLNDLLLLLLGEDPIRTVPAGGILFDSYDDPMINFINSNLVKMLMNIGGDGTLLGMPIPDVQYMGYFPHYNHTNDEDYLLWTGQDELDKAIQIIQWAGRDNLSWWSGEAAKIQGAGDGTFYKPFLTENDILMNFQSFACRSFNMEYDHEEDFNGIDAAVFVFNRDSYDSNKEQNFGYRYENKERVDYFPLWPTCHHNHTYDPNLDCTGIDCRYDYNFCNNCCDGSHYERQIFLPPGIVPQRCFPGLNKKLPFSAFLSPPHFSASPQEVRDTMVGLNPDPVKHEAGRWWLNPTTGGTVHASFNLQLSIPIYKDDDFMMTTHMVNAFFPSFWSHVDANLKPYALDFITLSAQTLPSIALGLGISFVLIAIIFGIIAYLCFRRRYKQIEETEEFTYEVNKDDEHQKTVTSVKIRQLDANDNRSHSPANKYPELYSRESPQGSLNWTSQTLRSERSNEPWK